MSQNNVLFLLPLLTGLLLFTGLPADGGEGLSRALAASKKARTSQSQHGEYEENGAPQSDRESGSRRTPVVRVVQEAGPAVVSIFSSSTLNSSPFALAESQAQRPGEIKIQAPQQQTTTQSLGSGVVIDGKRALILTNAHVIAGASQVVVRLRDGREFQAQLLGADAEIDLAVLRLELPKGDRPALPQARMGDSSQLMIGESVIAIGNPYGFSHTVTTGVVSALNRSVNTSLTTITGLIQTDAAINPGSSGGPLLNILGQVVGINAAIFNRGQGLNFAIPINKAKDILGELVSTGRVAHVWLGLIGQDMDPAQASSFGLDRVRGMVVTDVFPNTPAEAAGIRPGDALVGIAGRDLQGKSQCLGLMHGHPKGTPVKVSLRRGAQSFQAQLVPQELGKTTGLNLVKVRWGFSPGTGKVTEGVLVGEVRANGPAERSGLQPGDVVLQVGSQRTNNEEDLLSAFCRYQMHSMLIISVQRDRQIYSVRMKL